MSRALAARSDLPMVVLMASGSSSTVEIFLRGLSEPYGFWNTSCTACLNSRLRSGGGFTASAPISVSWPAVGFSISATMRARVDLPQPDSPTTASVHPRSMRNEMSPTARRCDGARNSPRRMS